MKNFYFSLKRKYSDYRFRTKLTKNIHKNKETILVHTMGKVGSSSILNSLEYSAPEILILHTHFLNHERLDKHLKQIIHQGVRVWPHVITSQVLQKFLSDRNWKIVTLVREPISRNISAFFQNIDIFVPNFVQRYRSGSLKIEEVIDTFLANYPHDLPLMWLDKEIKDVFGVDVFSVNFQTSQGYAIFHSEKIKLLLLRLENLNVCSGKAFRDFLGIEQFVLKNANIAYDKNYINIYNEFKKSITLPQDYIEKMYRSKYTQHFYSQAEIEMFRAKWSK